MYNLRGPSHCEMDRGDPLEEAEGELNTGKIADQDQKKFQGKKCSAEKDEKNGCKWKPGEGAEEYWVE